MIKKLYSLEKSIAGQLISEYEFPWHVLPNMGRIIDDLSKTLSNDFKEIKENVWVHMSAEVPASAYIEGPCIIEENVIIKHCAYIRQNVIVGKGSTVGTCTEIKNSILFDSVQAAHYNYIGDSILGYKAHLGAGAILSNVKADKSNICIENIEKKRIDSGLKKLGSFLGDYVEIGSNAVLNPGTIIGKRTSVYPLTSVRGYVGEDMIHKSNGQIVKKVQNGKEQI